MKTEARKVAAFRKRLATREASWVIDISNSRGWAIDIPARRRITLPLSPDQQALLRRTLKRAIPSVTLVLYGDELGPKGHALACLDVAGSTRTVRPPRKRAVRR